MSYSFSIVDVFTDQRFSGNQLAVLTDATGLSSEQMQNIAREFNYAESTFVLPAQDPRNDAQVRIFTPTSELPFAGHPNIGTAYVLSLQSATPENNDLRVLRFEEKAGIVPVQVKFAGGKPIYCELTAPESLRIDNELSEESELESLAAALSINRDDIVTGGHLPCRASVGLPFLIVEIKDLNALGRTHQRADLWQAFVDRYNTDAVLVYTRETGQDDLDVQARMYSIEFGIPEDPATGSANCALAGLLASTDSRESNEFSYRIAQGVEMGRPSRLFATVEKLAGTISSVRIGGACVMVAKGNIETN